jgi:hypothetical protein
VSNTPNKLRQLAIGAIVATAAAAAAACSTEQPLQPTGRVTGGAASRDAGALAPTNAGDAAQQQLLATIRQATAHYHRVDAAIADGYAQGSPCEAMPGQGIGIHYRKASLIDGVVDPSQPELLVYEPRKNGDIELVAVAFVVRASAWDPTHHSPPMLGDQVFEDKRVPDWSSPPFPNYELHVWVWKENPNGMYATTNPLVSCEAAP